MFSKNDLPLYMLMFFLSICFDLLPTTFNMKKRLRLQKAGFFPLYPMATLLKSLHFLILLYVSNIPLAFAQDENQFINKAESDTIASAFSIASAFCLFLHNFFFLKNISTEFSPLVGPSGL